MRLQNILFKFIAFVLSTIVILGLNLILLNSSGDLLLFFINSKIPLSNDIVDYYLFKIAIYILKVFGTTIIEVVFIWLVVILNILSIRSGLIITLVLLLLSGIIILVPISIY